MFRFLLGNLQTTIPRKIAKAITGLEKNTHKNKTRHRFKSYGVASIKDLNLLCW